MIFNRFIVFLLLSGMCFPLSAQISDNFSDGNFDQNPVWQGDAANFIVNASGELQLNATAAGTSVLAVQGNIPTSATWDFHFRLGFSPSNQNLLRIYLQANDAALSTGNGYFIEIGETGSNDPIRLFRQDAGVKTQLGVGQAGLVAVNPDIHLFVTRTFSGDWTVEAASGAGTLVQQFTCNDAAYAGGTLFFGVQCVYTVSNINKYFFDDLSISTGAPDTVPPVLLSAAADDDTHVTAHFNEPLDPLNAIDTFNYAINNGIGKPVSATLLPDGKSVQVTLAAPLFTGSFLFRALGVKDLAGNANSLQEVDFQYVKIDVAAPLDILINEIMADPTPVQGLPDAEYIELYNRSAKTIDLSSLRIKDATGPFVALPSFSLLPGAYVALTAPGNAAALGAATAGPVLGISVSTTILNNDGDMITLANAAGDVIDRVTYDLSWYHDAAKQNGGWSLERINPELFCLGKDNWTACPSANGGTPGLPNASLSLLPDTTPPHLSSITTESSSSLLLVFSEGVDQPAAGNSQAYRIAPGIQVASVELQSELNQVRLLLASPLQSGILYHLTAAASLTDCSGNSVPATDTLFFGLSETPTRFDIVVNEIMAQPNPPVGLPANVEWFELYNRSNKIIDLSSVRVQDLSGSPATLPAYILAPGQYVAVTALANVALLKASSAGPVLGAAISTALLNDDGDVIQLTSLSGAVIDRVAYERSWHTETGKDAGGWSLERINYDLPCLGSENWQSCPALIGGTPGAKNASYQLTTDEKPPHLLWAYPETPSEITLTFTEGLDEMTASDPGAYHFSPTLGVASVQLQPNPFQIKMTLATPMVDAVLYAVTVDQTLLDCSGNAATGEDTIYVGIPQKPDPQDIVVNEVMFNPAPGNPRYVEFYNRSNKVFDCGQFYIADFSAGASVKQISQKRISIPGEYHVFTPDPANVRAEFANIIQRNVMEGDLPAFSDKTGNVELYWSQNGEKVILDSLVYSDDWHNGLFSVGDREGVALERIRTDSPTNDAGNWTSAAPNVTGAPGTPTLPNSQRRSAANPAENMILLNPARISPDGDGREDYLDIQYALPKEGYAATVSIYDSDGLPVKKLVRQQLAGVEGSLHWDGETEDGGKVRPGIYILFVQLFHPDGEAFSVKKVFSVVTRP